MHAASVGEITHFTEQYSSCQALTYSVEDNQGLFKVAGTILTAMAGFSFFFVCFRNMPIIMLMGLNYLGDVEISTYGVKCSVCTNNYEFVQLLSLAIILKF